MKARFRLRLGLLTIATLGSLGVSLEGCAKPVRGPRSLANGVYFVLDERLSRDEIRAAKRPYAVVVYDRKYSDTDQDQPSRYLALDTSSFVPLILSGPPEAHKDDRGWTALNVTLARQHVKTLEDFTREHLGGVAAIVIDGEVITTHKVRSVIKDGKAMITRCGDDACKTLLLKLAK